MITRGFIILSKEYNCTIIIANQQVVQKCNLPTTQPKKLSYNKLQIEYT